MPDMKSDAKSIPEPSKLSAIRLFFKKHDIFSWGRFLLVSVLGLLHLTAGIFCLSIGLIIPGVVHLLMGLLECSLGAYIGKFLISKCLEKSSPTAKQNQDEQEVSCEEVAQCVEGYDLYANGLNQEPTGRGLSLFSSANNSKSKSDAYEDTSDNQPFYRYTNG